MSDRQTLESSARMLADLEEDPQGDNEEKSKVERLREVGQHLDSVLKSTSSSLVPVDYYALVWTHLGPLIQEVEAYKDDLSPSHLDSALNAVPGYLSQLNIFGILTRQPPPSEAAEEVTRLRRSIGQHRRVLDDEVVEAMQHLKDLEEEIASVKSNRLDLLVTEIEAAKSSSEVHLAGLQEQIASDKTRIDTFLQGSATTFDSAQESRREAFDELSQGLRSKLRDETAAITATNDRKMADVLAAANQRLTNLADLDSKAQGFYESVTNIALAGGYGHQAQEERSEANRMRWVAIAVGIAAASFAVLALGNWWPKTGFDAPHTLLKLTSTLSILSVAGYVVGQSRVHRRREERWRDIQLQLAAIEPFLRQSPFDDDTRKELLRIFALRTFVGQQSLEDESKVARVSFGSDRLIRRTEPKAPGSGGATEEV